MVYLLSGFPILSRPFRGGADLGKHMVAKGQGVNTRWCPYRGGQGGLGSIMLFATAIRIYDWSRVKSRRRCESGKWNRLWRVAHEAEGKAKGWFLPYIIVPLFANKNLLWEKVDWLTWNSCGYSSTVCSCLESRGIWDFGGTFSDTEANTMWSLYGHHCRDFHALWKQRDSNNDAIFRTTTLLQADCIRNQRL